MKPLSQVTKEDAITILSQWVPNIFTVGKWTLTDESDDIGEPTKQLSCTFNNFIFWFNDDEISYNYLQAKRDMSWSELLMEGQVKPSCYLKAHDLGYYIPGFSERIKPL